MLSRISSAAVLGIDAYPGRSRSGHQQRSAVLLDRRPAERGGQGGQGAGLRCSRQRRLSVSAAADHRQPGSRGHTQGWFRAWICRSPSGSWWPAASFPMLTSSIPWSWVRWASRATSARSAGALSMALAARAAGCTGLLLPADNLSEAAVVAGPRSARRQDPRRGVRPPDGRAARSLRSVDLPERSWCRARFRTTVDFADVRGQAAAKRALEVAAAGGPQHPAHRAARRREDHARPPACLPSCRSMTLEEASRPPGSTASPACLDSAGRSAPSGPSGHHTTR